MKLWMVAAILFSGVVGVTSCINKTRIEKEVESAARDMAMRAEAFTSVINNYLVDSIGSHYTPGEVCIPVVLYQIMAIWKAPSASLVNTTMHSTMQTAMRHTVRKSGRPLLLTM